MWSEREDGLRVVAAQTGETPKALLNKPRLWPWLRWYYEAFWLLDASRVIAKVSVRPIALTEMHAYLELFGWIGVEDRMLFVRRMRALDLIYVDHMNAEIRRKIEASKMESRSRRRDR